MIDKDEKCRKKRGFLSELKIFKVREALIREKKAPMASTDISDDLIYAFGPIYYEKRLKKPEPSSGSKPESRPTSLYEHDSKFNSSNSCSTDKTNENIEAKEKCSSGQTDDKLLLTKTVSNGVLSIDQETIDDAEIVNHIGLGEMAKCEKPLSNEITKMGRHLPQDTVEQITHFDNELTLDPLETNYNQVVSFNGRATKNRSKNWSAKNQVSKENTSSENPLNEIEQISKISGDKIEQTPIISDQIITDKILACKDTLVGNTNDSLSTPETKPSFFSQLQITEISQQKSFANRTSESPSEVLSVVSKNVEKTPKQVLIIKKKRSTECFLDVDLRPSGIQKAEDCGKVRTEMLIVNDPQHASVSATVTASSESSKTKMERTVEQQKTQQKSENVQLIVEKVDNYISDDSNELELKKTSSHSKKDTEMKNFIKQGVSSSGTDKHVNSDDFRSFTMPNLLSKNLPKSTNGQSDSTPFHPESGTGNVARRVSRLNAEARETATLTNKLSKGFSDFTQGSSDRLQRWKTKLQNGRKHKDTSEPPPLVRKIKPIFEKSGHSSDVEVITDWLPSKSSAHQVPNKKIFFAEQTTPNTIIRPRILHTTRSVNDLGEGERTSEGEAKSDSGMEHRTLRQRDENLNKPKNLSMHYQNLKNLQYLVQAVENCDTASQNIPPPARITPFSGIKPTDSTIIRPIAFRPFTKKTETRQSLNSTLSQKNDLEQSNRRFSGQDDSKLSAKKDDKIKCSNGIRPRPIYQPSTSSDAINSLSISPKKNLKEEIKNMENDYDIVPEYIEHEKFLIDDLAPNDSYSTVNSQQNGSLNSSQRNSQSNIITTFGVNSKTTQGYYKKPPSSQQYVSCASNGNRQSSGIHVTPSPSDSGIVDYETIIRDRETELSNVRSTMEQNEEVVIRVYQEKERIWKEQLNEIKKKLQASQQGENALRQQIQRCNEQREQFQSTIQNLTCDKQSLRKKCLQIERELFQFRERFDELLRNQENSCEICRHDLINSNQEKLTRPPVPAPRANKFIPGRAQNDANDQKNEFSCMDKCIVSNDRLI